MVRKLATIIIFLMSSVSLAQTTAVTTTSISRLANATAEAARVTAVPGAPPAFAPGPTIENVQTTQQTTTEVKEPEKLLCPPPSSYSLTPGLRLAGISPYPSCQAVQIRMSDIDEGLIDRNEESQRYQFTYGKALNPYRYGE